MINKALRFILEEFPHVNSRDASQAISVSLLSVGRLKSIGRCLKKVSELEGDTAEIGSFVGGTSKLIALVNNGKRHWVCDTFSGLLDAGRHDRGLTNGMFATTYEAALENLKDLTNTTLVKGYFPESAPPEMLSARYTFVHIDVDTYESIHACFNFFASRMVDGGLIALDDVLFDKSGCPGAQRAWRKIQKANTGAWKVFSEDSPQIVIEFGGNELHRRDIHTRW